MNPVEYRCGSTQGEGRVYVTLTVRESSGVSEKEGGEEGKRTWEMVDLVWFEVHGGGGGKRSELYAAPRRRYQK